MTAPIRMLPHRYDVSEAVAQIQAQPDVWNRHTQRTYDGDHKGVSDIWVRFRDFSEFDGSPDFFMTEHQSVWYPVAYQLPAVIDLVSQLFRNVDAEKLGGVLITKIPPGGEVKPHTDGGWHASYYTKYAIQLMGDQKQLFGFDDCELRANDGDSYTFDNSKTHFVKNLSTRDRITLIICVRKSDEAPDNSETF